MTKIPYLFLWTTRNSLFNGFGLWLSYHWFHFSYSDCHHVWYYWPMFILIFAFIGFAFLYEFTLIKHKGRTLQIYHIQGSLYLQQIIQISISKTYSGRGITKTAYYPITICGQVLKKDGRKTVASKTYPCGWLALKLFQRFCDTHQIKYTNNIR